MSDVVIIRVPGLHGPVHDWFIIPAWLDALLHDEDYEHEHKTEETP